nr:hypothetical protein [Salmonella sp.]
MKILVPKWLSEDQVLADIECRIWIYKARDAGPVVLPELRGVLRLGNVYP